MLGHAHAFWGGYGRRHCACACGQLPPGAIAHVSLLIGASKLSACAHSSGLTCQQCRDRLAVLDRLACANASQACVGCMHSPRDSPPLPQPLSPFPFLTQLLLWQLRTTPCPATQKTPAEKKTPAAACGRGCSCWILGKRSSLTVPLVGGLAGVCCWNSAPGSSCVQSSGAALLARLCSKQNGIMGQ